MTILKILQLIFSLGIGRYGLSLSDSTEEFMIRVDGKVSEIVKLVANNEIQPALNNIAKFFLILSIVYFIVFIIGSALFENHPAHRFFLAYFTFSTFAWISIKWFTSFKEFALKPSLVWLKLFLWIFALPVVDSLSGSNLTSLFYDFINLLLERPFNLSLPEATNNGFKALYLFVFYVGTLIIFVFLSTLYFGMFAFCALLIVWLTISAFRLLDKIWGKNHLTGIFIVGFILSVVLDWFYP